MSFARWKTPADLKQWLARRFGRDVAADLDRGRADQMHVPPDSYRIDTYQITAPGLSAGMIADNFAQVRSWANAWQALAADDAELEIAFTDWPTRQFGRVHTPKTVEIASVDCAARLLGRTRELAEARYRQDRILAVDNRFAVLGERWQEVVGMTPDEFSTLLRFLGEAAHLDLRSMRLREVPCAGMHTKFLESNRKLFAAVLRALEIAPNAQAQTWSGRLGLREDDTGLIIMRDLDGDLLPYHQLALPLSQFAAASPILPVTGRSMTGRILRGVVIVENQATFHALPTLPGVVAIFGQGTAVHTVSRASWLKVTPILYLGDLDHAGYQMVARLRRHGLAHLETALMDQETATAYRQYWVIDGSTAGSSSAYMGLQPDERAAQTLMAVGPWRLEQERIAFDQLLTVLDKWHKPLASERKN